MVIKYCEICNQRYIFMAHIGDIIHQCFGSSKAIIEEDVLDFHTSFTFDGVVTQNKKPSTALMSGVINTLQGTLAGVIGEDNEERTARGRKVSLYRQRPKRAYKIIPNINY